MSIHKNKKEKDPKAENTDLQKDLPVKTYATDPIKRAAAQSNGLNQEKISRDDLFPSDGDNLTN